METKKESRRYSAKNNNNIFYDKKIQMQLKEYYKDLKLLLNKRPINPKGKSELSEFKKQIIDLIKDKFKDKFVLFCGVGDEIDLQLFIEYLCQLFESKMAKMIKGYNILEKTDNNQLLLLSKTKNTILSFLISFYDFYEDELVINNEEIVAEIIKNKNILEDSFIVALVKTVNLLNMPYITKDEFINIFKEDKKSKTIILYTKDLGYLLLKIIEFVFKIRNLNINMNKKKISQKTIPSTQSDNNEERNSINKVNDQFSTFLGIFFEKIVPSLLEFFSNIILEYDAKNTINLIIKKDELNVLLNNFNHIRIIRHKIFNFLSASEKLFNKEENKYIKGMVIKNNLFDKNLFFINKDINNNKYTSLKDFLFEIKKIIKYYIVCNSQSDEIENKLINIILLGATKIKNKNINLKTPKNVKVQSNDDILISFFKEINNIGKEEPEQIYKVYNFLIAIFQSSNFLRKYIYKILLNNFAGDLDNYSDMLGHTNFLSVFVGNLCKCEGSVIDYFFGFLHSLDKYKYFPSLELTNIIYSLSCFTDVKSIQILMNNLELFNYELNSNIDKKKKKVNKIEENNNENEKKDLLEEMNKSFLDIFANIINDINSYYEEKNNLNKSVNKDIQKQKLDKKITEQRNIFSAQMVFPLLEYISKIIQDDKIYQYFMEKNFLKSLHSLFNTNEHKIVAYKFFELLMKSSKNKELNEDRLKPILNRVNFILNKDEKNKNKIILDEFEKIYELILILKSIITVMKYDILPTQLKDDNKKLNSKNKKDIKENIISVLSKCFDYFNINQGNIISIFNDKYHNLIKEYLNNFFTLYITSNQNCINKTNINAPVLEKQYFKLLIRNILTLYKSIFENKNLNEKKNYFLDIIIFLINMSLNLKQNKKINEEKDKKTTYNKDNINNDDLYQYYLNYFCIDENLLSDSSNYKNLYSNVCVQIPFLLTNLLNFLNELDNYIEAYLKILLLLCKINRGNISLLLRHKLLFKLLNISTKDDKYNNILLKIFQICLPFAQKKDLILIFNHLIKSYNSNKLNFTKEIIQCLIDSFQTVCFAPKEYSKGIVLSGYDTKQSNVYNAINIKNIVFNNFQNDTIIYIRQEIIFCETFENNRIILFRIDKNIDNKKNQYIEISIINGNLTAKENNSELNEQNEKNDMEINAKNFIRVNELNIFLFKFDNTEKILSININRKNIFSYPYKFSFNQNLSRSKAIIEGEKSLKYNYKDNNILITIGYPLETIKQFQDEKFCKISYIKVLSFCIYDEKNTNKKKILNIYELEMNEIFIESTKKNPYSHLTKYKLDKKTELISKYNLNELASLNYVFHRYNIKNQLYKYLIYLDKYLSYSLDYNFRIEKYIFILLNNNIDKDTFRLLIILLTNYVINNNENMSSFMEKEELCSTLYFTLLKNVKYIDSEIVDILFSCFLSQKNFRNNFLVNVFLDYKLFDNLSIESKEKALELIINKKLINGKSELIDLLFKKLYIILLLCDLNEDIEKTSKKSVDELITSIIIGIFSKNENRNFILKSIEELLYNLCKFHSMVKEHIERNNNKRPEETHFIITNFFHKLYNSISVMRDKDLLQKKIEELNNLNKNYKEKLIGVCKLYKPANLSTNIDITFRETAKRVRRLSVRDPKIIKLELEKKELNTIYEDDNLKAFQKFPKLVNEFIGGFKSKRKKTLNEVQENDKLRNNLDSIDVNDNNKWIKSEIKNSKNFETEKVICMGNCYLCNFIRIILEDLFTREIKFNVYEKYMINNYIETYIFNKNLDYKIHFGYYLAKEEGTSRIRNKFKLKVDKILNEELEAKTKKDNSILNIENNELENIFSFYKDDKISTNLCNFFNLGQIFNIDFISDCIDKGDTYQCSFNCLLFKGLNYINSVLILSEKKVYILTNMIIDSNSNLILYNAYYPINKSFWVVDKYSDMIPENFKYLEAYDLINDRLKITKKLSSKKISKIKMAEDDEEEALKSKQIRGFTLLDFSYGRINEIHKRRFLHQNNAIEIFLKTGINYYLAFNKDVRDTVVNKILYNISNSINYINNTFASNTINNCIHLNQITNLNNQSIKSDNMIFMTDTDLFVQKIKKPINLKNKQKNSNKYKNNCKIVDLKEILEQATEKWSNGFIDTYSYIMILNTLSGRTFNDLAQYPVYPWILNDYSSDIIDLKDSNTYRDFSYPIYAQDEESRELLKDKYNSFEEKELKYHSGSHFSNSAFVCYYLVRIKPYSISASEIQGGKFDSPDRLFFNIKNFYKVQTKYQELIPDFFNLPEIYINTNNFNFGKTLEGIDVTDVILPPWASNSPRLFSKMNKKALESEYVSQQINNWIDLIFGYKQKGSEAEKSYNVLREVCYSFNPQNCKDEEELELKISELCEMGIDPIQLFNKPHPKRERHHVMKAFFGRSAYLTYFSPTQNKYQIKNFNYNSNIKEMNKYYEDNSDVLSYGEGGLSSFRIRYDNNNDKNKDENKNNDIYFVVGENKKLLPPSYKHYIEWGNNNSFNLVKPLNNIKYKFTINHMKNKIISQINITRNGKFLVLGYNNGVIEKYVLQKIDESKINNEDNNSIAFSLKGIKSNETERRKSIFNTLVSTIVRKTDIDSPEKSEICKTFIIDRNPSENKDSIEILNTINNENERSISKNDNIFINKKLAKISFDSNNTISFSNILNSDCILLNNKTKKFYQYNSISSSIYKDISNAYDKISGYHIHSINQSEIKQLSKKKNENNDKNTNIKYIIFLVNSSSRIISDIYKIEICESFSFMVIIDKLNKIYLYDFNSFNLLKYIDFSKLFNLKMKYVSICPYTGEFIVATKRNVALMSINGVLLSQASNIQSNINSCFITLIPTTQSDLYLFTGHEDGDLIISKLIINNYDNFNLKASTKTQEKLFEENKKRKNCVRNAYLNSYNNKEQNYNQFIDSNNLPLLFDIVIKIKCSQFSLKYIKLTEDLTEIICIDKSNQIIYLNYKEFFNNKNKNKDKDKKNLKECPMCKSAISSSKILCYLCGKKLCAKCKIEEIIAEFSFKTKKAICEDCLQLMNSTNKLLYDF